MRTLDKALYATIYIYTVRRRAAQLESREEPQPRKVYREAVRDEEIEATGGKRE